MLSVCRSLIFYAQVTIMISLMFLGCRYDEIQRQTVLGRSMRLGSVQNEGRLDFVSSDRNVEASPSVGSLHFFQKSVQELDQSHPLRRPVKKAHQDEH